MLAPLLNAFSMFFKSEAEATQFAETVVADEPEMEFSVEPFQGGRFVVRLTNKVDGSVVRL